MQVDAGGVTVEGVQIPDDTPYAPLVRELVPRPRRGRAPRRALPFPLRHLVRPGDTLRSLAQFYDHGPSLWEEIYDANPDKIERGLPVEGTDLLIPARKAR